MQSELKPCPFCGSDRLMVLPPTCDRNTPYSAADRAYPVVRCSGCYTDVPGKDFDASSKSAVEAWNRRAALSDKQAGEVKTKPLEWEGELGTEYAASILGLYSVWEGHYRPPGAHGGIQADNPKQAAQDHLERIIRSALVDVPAVEPVTFRRTIAARKAHVDAVNTYNARLALVNGERAKGNWSIKVDDEAKAMWDAQSAFIKAAQEEADAAIYTSPPLSHRGEDSAEVESRFSLEWIAGARPPVHPDPMRGRQSFRSFDQAIAFMNRQANDAKFVSLTEYEEREFDRSEEARAALAATRSGSATSAKGSSDE